MSTYYVPRRSHSSSRATSSPHNDQNLTGREHVRDAPLRELPETSIYIFPSPASTPSSPGASVTSAPTDFDFSCPSDSRTTSRAWNGTPGGRRGSTSGIAYTPSDISFRYEGVATPSEDPTDIEVELWDAASDPVAEISESDESWALEGEVVRVGLVDFEPSIGPDPSSTRRFPLSSPYHFDAPGAQHRSHARYRRRSRTGSRVRTLSTASSLIPTSAQGEVPLPRVHIPLLSFFSSLLGIDLDDPALRLLTHTDPGDAESVLFPGQSSTRLLSLDEEVHLERRETLDSEDDSGSDVSLPDGTEARHEVADIHGLPKLLLAAISDQSSIALGSLRAGLAVQMPTASVTLLPIPRMSDLLDVWRKVGEVCTRSGQAWKEIWDSGAARQPMTTGRDLAR
ncbi:hypothetical protein GY45DRAFT_1316721 [Cubamyces sp. BRFM 1775]|nr:hypothetical protein GY45DRAFT_1316721 [Cubamyces sp. BRFM 1775]